MNSVLVIQDFKYGNIECEKIEIKINNRIDFLVFFTKNCEAQGSDLVADEYGIDADEDGYQIKFESKSNFDNDTFYEQPDIPLNLSELNELGKELCNAILFHCRNKNAKSYFFIAENKKLKKFYDRLITKYAESLDCDVTKDLGESGYGYNLKIRSI